MLHCGVCLGEYVSPFIINSGISFCCECLLMIWHRCPETHIKITNEIRNDFITKFFRYQLAANPPPKVDDGKVNHMAAMAMAFTLFGLPRLRYK